jgi:hypothetical protein
MRAPVAFVCNAREHFAIPRCLHKHNGFDEHQQSAMHSALVPPHVALSVRLPVFIEA